MSLVLAFEIQAVDWLEINATRDGHPFTVRVPKWGSVTLNEWNSFFGDSAKTKWDVAAILLRRTALSEDDISALLANMPMAIAANLETFFVGELNQWKDGAGSDEEKKPLIGNQSISDSSTISQALEFSQALPPLETAQST